jgi:hypothetical protein
VAPCGADALLEEHTRALVHLSWRHIERERSTAE